MVFHMNKLAEVRKLVPGLKIRILPRHRLLKNPDSSEGRMKNIRFNVTKLIKEERMEISYQKGDEVRMYAERLIAEAVRFGDCHKPTMEIADYYLLEKQLIHKLFKVLVPRFKEYEESYTNLMYIADRYPKIKNYGVLELKGNPYPPIVMKKVSTHNWINNILLDEARKEYNQMKSSSNESN